MDQIRYIVLPEYGKFVLYRETDVDSGFPKRYFVTDFKSETLALDVCDRMNKGEVPNVD